MPDDSPRVLIIRLDGIGDALALAPLLAALHEHRIAVELVLRDANAEAFAARAAERIHRAPFDLRDGSRANRERIAAFGRTLRGRYTHALVATEDPGGYLLAAAIAAPVRVGFVNGWGKPLKTLWVRRLMTHVRWRSAGLDRRAPHECAVLFGLGEPLLGAHVRPTRDPAVLRPLVLDTEPDPCDAVVVQVTDKWERSDIAFTEVVAAARAVAEVHPVRALASAAEEETARRFERKTGIAVERFATLPPWKAAVASARAVIAPDGGAVHVAGMTGTPVVAVFPPQPAFHLQVARWSPWAAPHVIVEARPGRWPDDAARAALRLAPAIRNAPHTT